MAPSEIFKTTRFNTSSAIDTRQSCRKRLQGKFEECDRNFETKSGDRSVLSVLSLNDNTRRVLRNGAERLAKTLNNVRTTFGTLTQKFRVSTRRRQILEEGPMTPNGATPHSFSKQLLGRTPTKLYSPFGIETPHGAAFMNNKENRISK